MTESKKQTVMAFVRLACMLVVTALAMAGIAVDANALFTVVMIIISAVVAVWSWWKNNNVTEAATSAQEVLDELKKGITGKNAIESTDV